MSLVLLTSTTVNPATASVTFSSINQGYKDLLLRYSVRSTTTSTTTRGSYLVRVNGSTSGYSAHTIYGQYTSGASPDDTRSALLTAGTSWTFADNMSYFPDTTENPNQTNGELYFPDYASATLKKTVLGRGGYIYAGAINYRQRNEYFFGLFDSISAITSISLTANSTFAVYSNFQLYGVT